MGHAQPSIPGPRPEAAASSLPEELRRELELNPQQVTAIARLREDLRQGTATNRSRARAIRAEQVEKALRAPPGRRHSGLPPEADPPELASVMQQISAAEQSYRSQVRGLLTPAQLATLERLERAAQLARVVEQAQCFALLKEKPPAEPAACEAYLREP